MPARSPGPRFMSVVIDATRATADWLRRFDPLSQIKVEMLPQTLRRPTAIACGSWPAEDQAVWPASALEGEVGLLGRPAFGSANEDGRITYEMPSRGVAIVVGDGSIEVSGATDSQVGMSIGVLAAEWIAERARSDGWHLVHGSCFVLDGNSYLCVGPKGSGKSTLALVSAAHLGAQLIGNDRCLVRTVGDSTEVLALPQACGIGFGLIDALGWGKRMAAAASTGGLHHPSVRGARADALKAGRSSALTNETGLEVKLPLLAGELTEVFGIRWSPRAKLTAVLRPTVGAQSARGAWESESRLQAADLLTCELEAAAERWLRPRRETKPSYLDLAAPSLNLTVPKRIPSLVDLLSEVTTEL